jgi:hypothetical protein
MRTTLNIADDVFIAVKHISQSTNTSIGEVVTELIRKSLKGPERELYENDIPVFHVSENAKAITLEDVKKDDDE